MRPRSLTLALVTALSLVGLALAPPADASRNRQNAPKKAHDAVKRAVPGARTESIGVSRSGKTWAISSIRGTDVRVHYVDRKTGRKVVRTHTGLLPDARSAVATAFDLLPHQVIGGDATGRGMKILTPRAGDNLRVGLRGVRFRDSTGVVRVGDLNVLVDISSGRPGKITADPQNDIDLGGPIAGGPVTILSPAGTSFNLTR